MKVALLQFAPVFKDVDTNIAIATRLIERQKAGDIDWLILPELAFTGYVFQSKEDIAPWIEDSENGPSVTWAKKWARSLECFVQVGFPRKDSATNTWKNSIVVCDPHGNIQIIYDKHFLYEVDERWAVEGSSFQSVQISTPKLNLKVGFGICMDINPYRFQAPSSAYEYGNFHKEQDTELVSASMAWVLSKDASKQDQNEPGWVTINYWLQRLTPLWRKNSSKKQRILAICNRIGGENDVEFCGSSCVIVINEDEPTLLGAFGVGETGIKIIDVPLY